MCNLTKYKRIVSAIQPTGNMHLGNYLGSIKSWVKLQEEAIQIKKRNEKEKQKEQDQELFFSLADLHALTTKYQQSPGDSGMRVERSVEEECVQMASYLLGCNISPEHCVLFVQSQVPEVVELQWLLGCLGPMHWLNTMTQFKDKRTKGSSLALFSYPTLMAADILLFKAHAVPVGQDQLQHLELTRKYASRFNSYFQVSYFPQIHHIPGNANRVMSLRDGKKKMSKSELSEMSRINLKDSPETIFNKVMKGKTDCISEVYYDKDNRPEVSNLIQIYAALSALTPLQVQHKFTRHNTKEFKEHLAELLVKQLYPIQLQANQYLEDKQQIISLLKYNSEKARHIANENLKEIKKIMGLIH